jgi:membrane associated rhomboid family serine protease
MIPLRDNATISRFSPANTLLIVANVLVYAYEASLGPYGGELVYRYGLIPARVSAFGPVVADGDFTAPVTIVSSMFLHGSFFHLAGNMLYLFIFGAAVEQNFGAARYLIFYLLAGIAAGIATIWMEPASTLPVVGASGAIAGVLGGYFILYPRARILTILPLVIFVEFVEVPAVVYLFLWFGVQLLEGLRASSAAYASVGGVAWWAHVGGFLFGLGFAPLLKRRENRRCKSGRRR